MYAIWKYDQFPYILCDKIKFKDKEGICTMEHYGGMRFLPLNIITNKQGVKMKELIENIRAEKRKEKQDLDDKYNYLLEYRKSQILENGK